MRTKRLMKDTLRYCRFDVNMSCDESFIANNVNVTCHAVSSWLLTDDPVSFWLLTDAPVSSWLLTDVPIIIALSNISNR